MEKTLRGTCPHDSREDRRSGQMGTIISMCKMKRNGAQLCKFVTTEMHKILHGNKEPSLEENNLRNRRKLQGVFHDADELKEGMNSIKLAQY